jgi:atypical dual specificity phosphatase
MTTTTTTTTTMTTTQAMTSRVNAPLASRRSRQNFNFNVNWNHQHQRRGCIRVAAKDDDDTKKTCITEDTAEAAEAAAADAAYNAAMKAYSSTPYEYNHEAGLYYHVVRPGTPPRVGGGGGVGEVIVGTQPTSKRDIDRLRDVEGVMNVLNTQRDEDMEYWKVDFSEVKAAVAKRRMTLARVPFVDFCADSLRSGLPEGARVLDALVTGKEGGGGATYVHCTAGMGRSPALVIAYMYWFLDEYETLDGAYEGLTSIRPCGPKKESIRLATCDVLAAAMGGSKSANGVLDAAALDANAGTRLSMEEKRAIRRFLRR